MLTFLHSIKNIETEIIGHCITITNSGKHKATLDTESITSTEIIFSDIGEKGCKISLDNDKFLIVTSGDFIFSTQRTGLFTITNLPGIVSLNEIIENAEKYIENPEPDKNIDNTVALYLLNKTLLENAAFYNFDVSELKQRVRNAAMKTDAIGDISIYD